MINLEHQILSEFEDGPDEIAEELREFSKSAELLSNDRPRLIHEYLSKWIGVYGSEVAAEADDFETLIEKLKEKGVPLGSAIVRLIEENQRTLIL